MTETGKPKDWPSGITWGSPKHQVDWANVRKLHEADMERARMEEADEQMPGIIVSSRMLTPYESIKVPGTRVQLMRGGSWDPEVFTVTDHVGRTPDHIVLRTSRGDLFEEYVDEYSVGNQIRVV